MGDSSSFSSLFALVDNHLSKSNLQQDASQPSTSGMGSFRLPPLNAYRGSSDTGLGSSSTKFPIPSLSLTQQSVNDALAKRLQKMNTTSQRNAEEDDDDSPDKPGMCMSDCPINDVLAIQLSNMFKARQLKEEEERKKQEEMKKVQENLHKLKLEESSCLIDLMPAVQRPGQVRPKDVEVISSSSSMESVVVPDAPEMVEQKPAEPQMPIVTIPWLDIPARPLSPPKPVLPDITHVLKLKRGKCSPFGKVLCARYKPVAAPYFRIHIPPKGIKVFDFSTPSPDDIVLERLRRPSYYNNSNRELTVYE